MENTVYHKIQKIAQTKDQDDIRDVKIIIGKYRVMALKYYGVVRRFIFKQADEIEKELERVILE